MITEVKADILDLINKSSENKALNVFLHQCNCQNVMGKGIAKAISTAYPEVARADNATKAGDKAKLGTYSYARVKENVVVANAYSQYNYGWLNPLDSNGRQTDYEALRKSLTAVRDDFTGRSTHPVIFYIPKYIGANNAKGNPRIIQPMVKEIFKDHELVLFYN
jgi:hypothetical protein